MSSGAQSLQMVDVRVNASIGYQADQMKTPTFNTGVSEGLPQHGVALQTTLSDGLVDAGQFLPHDAPRTDIEVAYFGVAHLPLGQTYGFAMRGQGTARAAAPKPIRKRRASPANGIGLRFAADGPSVQNNQASA
jgi:hypothetical protein